MDAHILWSVEWRAEIKVCDVECHETSAFFGDGGIEEEFHSREIGSEGGSFTLVVGEVATVGAADAALYDIVFDFDAHLRVVVGGESVSGFIARIDEPHNLVVVEKFYEFDVFLLPP